MTTTIMRDSVIGDKWILDTSTANPTQMLPSVGDGLISTGPVRLAFCEWLFTARKPRGRENDPSAVGKFSTMALYTPYSNMQILYDEYYRVLGAGFPEYYVPEVQGYPALESPFHDQASKLQYSGFTPGLIYCNHTSKFKPQVVDANRNPIVDPAKVYPGVWAILVLNAYGFGKNPPQPKKGCAFGLQAVMVIGDDKPLAGGGIDPREAFKMAIVKPPVIAPGALVGLAPGQPAGPVPVGGLRPPVATPGAPAGFRQGVPPPPPRPVPPPPLNYSTDEEVDLSSIL
jgi:hypothetical protein